MSNVNCWAKEVSECCSTQSREHYITKGLFSDKIVKVSGAPFLNGEEKLLSKASLTKKCLCSKHNSLLSLYDDEAIKFANSLKYAHKLSMKRRDENRKKFPTHYKFSDADAFSRWLVKTYINMLDFFPKPPVIDESALAKLVFSRGKIVKFLSYRISMDVGDKFQITESVGVAPLMNEKNTVGLSIWIYGVNIQAIIHDTPKSVGKLPKIKFNDINNGLSCVVGLK